MNYFLSSIKSEKGYLLYELLIVLSLVSILFISIPTVMSSSFDSQKRTHYFDELEHDLFFYQLYSATHEKDITFHFTQSTASYVVTEGIKVIDRHSPKNPLRMTPLTLGPSDLQFMRTGKIRSAGRIGFVDNDEIYVIVFQLVRGRFYFYKL